MPAVVQRYEDGFTTGASPLTFDTEAEAEAYVAGRTDRGRHTLLGGSSGHTTYYRIETT